MNNINDDDMKRSRLYALVTVLVLSMAAGAAMSAENICQEDWKKKMMSEKIAFLSVEIDITPEEAQTFWPIYNQVNQERDEAMFKVFKAYKELDKAVSEGKGAKEISDLLEAYLDAQKAQRELEGRVAERYGKALPMEKVARLYIAEEKFRRNHIRKLHGGGHRN